MRRKKAEESELKFLITDKNISEEIPEGYVLTQKLKAGSLTEKGETIEVGVSAGLNSLTAEEIEKRELNWYKSRIYSIRIWTVR